MVRKSFLKSNFRMFKKHFTRMISIICIILLSVAFVFGVGASKDKICDSLSEYYINQNVSDFIIKSKSRTGFSNQDVDNLKTTLNLEDSQVQLITTFDLELDDLITRLYYLNFDSKINKLEIVEGRLPTTATECVVERETLNLIGYKINDTIEISGNSFTVVGIVNNPLIINKKEEISSVDNKPLDRVVYFNSLAMLPKTDIWVSIGEKDMFDAFSQDYEKLIEYYKTGINSVLENIHILTLYENIGFYAVVNYAEKIETITIILMLAFVLVASLVVLTTMSRLVEEERAQIACLVTLGYPPKKITNRYLTFALISTLIGGGLAYFLGNIVCKLVYGSFNMYYAMPTMSSKMSLAYYLIVFALIFLAVIFVTIFTCKKMTSEKPSILLQPKAPKSGKKVFLEKIPFIWNKLSFKYKSTFRNILRHKKHFFMTVISIAGATALVFLGLGVLDFGLQDEAIGKILTILAIVVVIFS